MDLDLESTTRCFAGEQRVYRHRSTATATDMAFSVYLPPQAAAGPCPAVLYLSGLTCTWENVTTKGGFQAAAARAGLIVICPDTSPRGADVPDDGAYDFGQGAGFYVNATQAPWARHYRMYDYVARELPDLLAAALPVRPGPIGVFGHSMGGHGALTVAVRNPDQFASVSAFAPICAPTQCPWGHKAFTGYLGSDRSTWADHDACHLLVERGWTGDILVDQGTADGFLDTQLMPDKLKAACAAATVPLTLRLQPDYDHSYYFIASFMADHVAWHAARLNRLGQV